MYRENIKQNIMIHTGNKNYNQICNVLNIIS